jgi:tetratricopeptide (TPR) repeat protein
MNADPAAAGMALFDLLEGAEAAEKKKDYATAVKYYRALAQIVPEQATAFSKLCENYELMGDRQQGIAACYRATGLPGAKVADNVRYVRLLLSAPPGQALTPAEAGQVRATLEHLAGAGVENAEIDLLGCQFAVAIESRDAIRGCVQRLEQTQPGSPITLTYRMSLALLERNFSQARALIEEARRIPLNPEAIALMQKEVDALENPGGGVVSRLAGMPRGWRAALGALGAAIVAGAALLWARRRRLHAA